MKIFYESAKNSLETIMGKSTKLIQLGKYFHPVSGGMETHLYDLCTHFKDKFDIEVLVANTENKTVFEVVDGIKITRLASLGELFSNPICPTFPYHLSRLNGEPNSIIQIHLPNPMAHISYLMANPVGRLIVMWHSDIVRQKRLSKLYDRYLLRLLDRADCIVATSQNYIESSPYLKKFADKCIVVPLGIRTQKFEKTPEVRAKVNQIKQKYGERLILFVGRFTYYKGLENLLEAAKKIDGTILLIGDGPLRERIANIIRENNLENKVFLEHHVCNRELVSFYHACDVFVLPSNQRSEAFGVVQLEAMFCEKPTVSTDLRTGVPWVNQHGETGLVVPVNNVQKLTNAINYLLENKEERRYLGKNAKCRVLENFTIEIVTKKMAAVYEQVLNGGIKKETFKQSNSVG